MIWGTPMAHDLGNPWRVSWSCGQATTRRLRQWPLPTLAWNVSGDRGVKGGELVDVFSIISSYFLHLFDLWGCHMLLYLLLFGSFRIFSVNCHRWKNNYEHANHFPPWAENQGFPP